jgi:hypothetical protein
MRNVFKKKISGRSGDDAPIATTATRSSCQYVELGTIHYVNLTADGKHGDYQTALDEAFRTGKPIFANFVEWSG